MAWNIQIAEICSVIFDVHSQVAFKAASVNAYIFIFFPVCNQIDLKVCILYPKLCASPVMFRLYLGHQIYNKFNDYL